MSAPPDSSLHWHSRTGDKRTAASLSRKICRGLNVSWEPLPLRAVRERVIWRRMSILNGQAERCGIPTRERSGDLTYYSRRQCFFFLWFLLKTARQEANARKGMFIYYVIAERGGYIRGPLKEGGWGCPCEDNSLVKMVRINPDSMK